MSNFFYVFWVSVRASLGATPPTTLHMAPPLLVPQSDIGAAAKSLRKSFLQSKETTSEGLEALTLEDVCLLFETWRVMFVAASLIVAYICHTLYPKTQHVFSRKKELLWMLIVFTSWILSLKALTKLFYPHLSALNDMLLESAVEQAGSVCLVGFWLLFTINQVVQVRAKAEVTRVYRNVVISVIMMMLQQLELYSRLWVNVEVTGVYQYVGMRFCFSASMMMLQQLGLYSRWVKVLVQTVLFCSEGYSIMCVTLLGASVGTTNLIWMFGFYKFFKYFIWFQEPILLFLGNSLHVSKDIVTTLLNGVVVMQMLVVSLLQHILYRV